ncbi:PH domain-containing protein [Corynebacterium aquatimens]|uniref:PH domain-containing protein n=1 Tax=Corynebacterium TaxID=1716 RepID=UPI001F319942|nr:MULTISPECIES: PH domain-containing protein [Corynebacterium]QYH19847.1 PH domain-containing protein [Corynebacterium aquatimens]UIZ93007.1 PH domain-containing protein [Corynebacterium sp. CNCTC7651]
MSDASTVFRPSKEHVIAIVLMTGIALIGIAWAPLVLGWLLIFPILALVWVYKATTTVGEDGVSMHYVFRKDASVTWEDLAGVSFRGSKALATTKNGTEYPMPGVTFNSLPELAEASRGRITDVITQAEEAADGKYEIIDKEGRGVLLSREEYDEYLQAHPDTPGPRPSKPTEGDNL